MTDRDRRWRLVLGQESEQTLGGLGDRDRGIDAALAALYGTRGGNRRPAGGPRQAGLGASAPTVARWLGDIRTYFPSSVVRVMQQDAVDRLGLRHLLLEPEMLDAVEPDVHLVSTLLSLNGVMPEQTRASARQVVAAVVRQLEAQLRQKTVQAITGALNRAARTRRPRPGDIDWDRTIRANLRHYQADLHTVIPETLIGFGRKQQAVQKEIVLCIDQSGSMATSVVYSSIFGAVMASLRSVRTSLVVFDPAVVDLTPELDDPVDLLFGTQLGGGTDINGALAYCQTLITRPPDTIFVLISDLIEGGIREEMLQRAGAMVASGVCVIALLALSDDGAPVYDHQNAAALASLGIPAFACTPDAFPDLMAAAIQRRDLAAWAAGAGITTAAPM